MNPRAKLTAKQAALYLGVSESLLRKWRGEHYGPVFYRPTDAPNCPVLYEVADLDVFVAQRKRKAAQHAA
ncbi:hypothetical protein ACMEZZ_07260 [Bifidobacterium adolescentis]